MGKGSPNEQLESRVCVVIVNFNAGPLLVRAVSSSLESTVPVRVIVVDNWSSDGSLAALRAGLGADQRLTVIENQANLGFSAAVNVALRCTSSEFFLLLNPDCEVKPDTIGRVLEVMDRQPAVGLAGCLVRNPDGSEQAGCRRNTPTPGRALLQVLGRTSPSNPGVVLSDQPLPDQPTPVDAISGAFMLARGTAIEAVGLLDESYFLHCEDLDWCMRFRQRGWDIWFVPGAEAMHRKGYCSQANPRSVLWHKHKGMIVYYRKFFQQEYSLAVSVLIVSGVWVRFGLFWLISVVGAVRDSVFPRRLPPSLHIPAHRDHQENRG